MQYDGDFYSNETMWLDDFIDDLKRNRFVNKAISQRLNDIYHELNNINSTNEQTTLSTTLLSDSIDWLPNVYGYTKLRPQIYGSFLCLLVLIGTLSNFLVIGLSLKQQIQKQCTSLQLLLINLSCACLLYLLATLPLLITENIFGHGWTTGGWALSPRFCELHRYLVYVSLFATGYSTILLLFHQTLYMHIPARLNSYNSVPYTFCITIIMWVLIILCNIPNYLGHGAADETPGVSYCFHVDIQQNLSQVQAWSLLQFLFTVMFPDLLIIGMLIMILAKYFSTSLVEYNQLPTQDGNFMAGRHLHCIVLLPIVLGVLYVVCWTPFETYILYLVLNGGHTGLNELMTTDVLMCLAYSYLCTAPLTVLVLYRLMYVPQDLREATPRKKSNSLMSNLCCCCMRTIFIQRTQSNNTELNNDSLSVGYSDDLRV